MKGPNLLRFKAETELGPPIVSWLQEQGLKVYQEVDMGCIADVVGVVGPLVVVVELKLALSFDLLHQARRWRFCAHEVWAAVPAAKRFDGRRMALQCFEREGVGVLEVERRGEQVDFVNEVVQPAFTRSAIGLRYVEDALRPENLTVAKAGSPAKHRSWTPFKLTCDRVREYLATHPGASVGDVVRDVEHHYASPSGARARLHRLIEQGVVAGVEFRGDGRERRLFLKKED